MKRRFLIAAALIAIAGNAMASWYDDYAQGIAAVRTGQWAVVIQKMSVAIAGNPKENDNARTYGNIFIPYHPYYYRGLGYLRTGKYDQAISDFEKTSGPGEVDRGSLDNLMQEAKMKQAQATTPEPVPQPQPQPPPVPTPQPQPAKPTIDPALQKQVGNAINAANQSLSGARARKAGSSPQYQQALTALADANQKATTAKTNDDLQAALAFANNAKLYADNAMPPNVPPVPLPPTPPQPTKPTIATGDVLGDTAKRLHAALEGYFNGEFDTASDQFRDSHRKCRNGWIWAFLGASQYSRYAFEADETYKTQALQSFKKAKQYHNFKNGLPQRYFSTRIRQVFETS
jgi:tetratricopeptide (TPR) repeat protein